MLKENSDNKYHYMQLSHFFVILGFHMNRIKKDKYAKKLMMRNTFKYSTFPGTTIPLILAQSTLNPQTYTPE